MKKFDKSEVGFEHPAKGPNHCGACTHYIGGGYCAIVSGLVLAQDWCKKFSKEPMLTKLSPAEINKKQADEARCCEKEAAKRANVAPAGIKEHDKITSRTNGKTVEISLGPNGGGLVPANPFASLAQEGFLHAHPEKLGPEKLAEFDAATKGKKLPKRVKKAKK